MSKQATAFFKKTLEQLSLGVYWKNKVGHYIDCNFYFCQLLGINSIDLIIGKTDGDLDYEVIDEDVLKASANQAVNIIEKNIICADGLKKYLLIREFELSNDRYDRYERVGIVEEITYFKKEILTLKKAKRETQTYLENIIANMPGSVYWKDINGVYLGCNDYVARIAGVASPKEVIGQTDYAFSWRDEAAAILKTEREVMENKAARELEISGKLFDGTKATFLVIKAPLYNASKEVVGILATSLDITERKRLEENLIVAREKAEVASQAKTEFLENMRHDIRTPVAGIVGCAQLIQAQASDAAKVTEFATDLVESSDALLEFLNKVLESIKVASGEIPLLKKKFNLRKILEQIIHLNKPYAISKKLTLNFLYDDAIPKYVIGDPFRIQKIVLELLTNALKFTEKGQIQVAARLMKGKTKVGQILVKLSLSDAGIGVPLDQQNEIYTRFKRLTPAYQGTYSGTGLGLSVVKQFMEDLGGELSLKSQPNQGSTFTCLIPLQEPLLMDSEDVEEILPIASKSLKRALAINESLTGLSNASGGRVLVVEDQAIAAKIAQHVLTNL